MSSRESKVILNRIANLPETTEDLALRTIAKPAHVRSSSGVRVWTVPRLYPRCVCCGVARGRGRGDLGWWVVDAAGSFRPHRLGLLGG
jgi:hypothetical protein